MNRRQAKKRASQRFPKAWRPNKRLRGLGFLNLPPIAMGFDLGALAEEIMATSVYEGGTLRYVSIDPTPTTGRTE